MKSHPVVKTQRAASHPLAIVTILSVCSERGTPRLYNGWCHITKKGANLSTDSFHLRRRLPTLPLLRSTIGVTRLNFSVRNGKRWIPRAIATLISLSRFWPDINPKRPASPYRLKIYQPSLWGKSRAISTTRLGRRRPYTCGLSRSSSITTLEGDLILRPASYLDAFSTYPIRT